MLAQTFTSWSTLMSIKSMEWKPVREVSRLRYLANGTPLLIHGLEPCHLDKSEA